MSSRPVHHRRCCSRIGTTAASEEHHAQPHCLGLHLLAPDLQFPEGPVINRDDSLLIVEIERRIITRIREGGRSEIVARLEGGPSGLACGPDYALYVCNHGGFLFRKIDGINHTAAEVPEGHAGGWIERVAPDDGEHRVLYARCGEHNLVGPNDLVFDAHGGFYFTDYGKIYPRYRTADSITPSPTAPGSSRSPIR